MISGLVPARMTPVRDRLADQPRKIRPDAIQAGGGCFQTNAVEVEYRFDRRQPLNEPAIDRQIVADAIGDQVGELAQDCHGRIVDSILPARNGSL